MTDTRLCVLCNEDKPIHQFYDAVRKRRLKSGLITSYKHSPKWCGICEQKRRKEIKKTPRKKIPETLRICKKCNIEKSLDSFRVRRRVRYRLTGDSYLRSDTPRVCSMCEDKDRIEWDRTPKGKEARKKRHQREWADPIKRQYYLEYGKSEKGRLRTKRNFLKRVAIIAVGDLDKTQLDELFTIYDGRCAYCGGRNRIGLDHVIPLSRAGTHTFSNVVPCCWSCNQRKGIQIWEPRKPYWWKPEDKDEKT